MREMTVKSKPKDLSPKFRPKPSLAKAVDYRVCKEADGRSRAFQRNGRWGREEIRIAETGCPPDGPCAKSYGKKKPLKGARIAGCLHMTIDRGADRNLIELGAKIRWSSCNIFSTQDHAAVAMAAAGVPVFAWKGEPTTKPTGASNKRLRAGVPRALTLILDDGGDLTNMMHEKRYAKEMANIIGISEETTTGVHNLERLHKDGKLQGAGDQHQRFWSRSRNSITCTLPRVAGRRHQARDPTSCWPARSWSVAGYGDVGKGCAHSMRSYGSRVIVTEIDPICALQAAMEGFEVTTMEDATPQGDHLRHHHRVLRHHHREALQEDEVGARSSATSATSTSKSTWPG